MEYLPEFSRRTFAQYFKKKNRRRKIPAAV
jgi:hypothetical protein